jgi:hypothetical protein
MKKSFFILPGFRMQATDKPFAWLIDFLQKKKINVIKVPVKWNYHTLSQNAVEFIEFFNQHKSGENHILGFSYGAVITLLTANILKPKKIYLCSLSPDFIEDAAHMRSNVSLYIGKKRFADIQTRSGMKLAKNLAVPSTLFLGEKEAEKYPPLKTRANETVKFAKNSKLIIVKDSPHQIDFPTYIEAIKKEMATL